MGSSYCFAALQLVCSTCLYTTSILASRLESLYYLGNEGDRMKLNSECLFVGAGIMIISGIVATGLGSLYASSYVGGGLVLMWIGIAVVTGSS